MIRCRFAANQRFSQSGYGIDDQSIVPAGYGIGRKQDTGARGRYHLLHHHAHLCPVEVGLVRVVSIGARAVERANTIRDGLFESGLPLYVEDGFVQARERRLFPVFTNG